MLSLSDIGREIALVRKQKRLSQSELAIRAMVSRPTIAALENGRAPELGYSKLIRILASLGLELRLQSITRERPTLDDLMKENAADD